MTIEKRSAPKFTTILAVVASLLGVFLGAREIYNIFVDNRPIFNDDIALVHLDNEAFADFLFENAGNVVEIDSQVDLSPALSSFVEVLDKCNDAYTNYDGDNALLDGYFYNREITLPINAAWQDDICYPLVTFKIDHPRDAVPTSHGGTGIVTLQLKGVFLVRQSFLSGGQLRYTLEFQSLE